ncbi:metalloregulator ArsR/SmtB family transcription factor [Nocardioidaceae bacterium]|nr:metalloregulator ArsR/SmtB family transcription factor [Nocardioidaceae bacterium]
MTMMSPIGDTAVRKVGRGDSEASAALFRALGDPSRLAILGHLHLGPHRVVDLVDHLGLAQSTASKHLACLRDCGLVQSRPRGRASVFSLTPGVPVRDVLAAAERVLAVTFEAATDCPTAGDDL